MPTDEHIEYWGQVFTANDLHRRGLRFDRFIRDPHAYLRLRGAGDVEDAGDEPRPLLPQQRAVQARIDLELLDEQLNADLTGRARLRDQALVEPLRHHAQAWKR